MSIFTAQRNNIRTQDPTRNFLSSSPTNGALVDTDEMWVGRWGDGNSPYYGDVHFYTYDDCWNVTIFPTPRFTSEYGFQVSSF